MDRLPEIYQLLVVDSAFSRKSRVRRQKAVFSATGFASLGSRQIPGFGEIWPILSKLENPPKSLNLNLVGVTLRVTLNYLSFCCVHPQHQALREVENAHSHLLSACNWG